MASSGASTVEEYLEQLPEERRAVVSALREVVLRNLPEGYREAMHWGMITYCIPLERYPNTYNGAPLAYAAIAAQKKYYSLYLMGVYSDPEREQWLRERFERAGKKLDMGKSCLRFKTLDALPLDTVGEVIAGMPVDEYLARYEATRRGARG